MASTAAPRACIKPIDRSSVHRICSGQVILDLATAVKELVENALDAGATNIEVRLKEYGSQLIEVADNGSGVAPEDYEALTLKYHTSKLSNFDELQSVGTFGFRGEALSSLCAVSELSVITRTAAQDVAVRLEFGPSGKLVAKAPCARAVGTTVAVKDLFKPLPVRHKELQRNIRRDFAKLVAVLQAYALISSSARIVATNQAGKGGRTTVVATQHNPKVADNLSAVLGAKAAATLQPLEVEVEDGPPGAKIVGYVSRANMGVTREPPGQFLYINGRPVELPKAVKVLNEVYRSLASPAAASLRPMAVLDIQLPAGSVDVNVTPDKRKVFLHHEDTIMQALQKGLQQLWEPSRYTYCVNGAKPAAATGKRPAMAAVKAARPAKRCRGNPYIDDMAAVDGGASEDEEEEDEDEEQEGEEDEEEEEGEQESQDSEQPGLEHRRPPQRAEPPAAATKSTWLGRLAMSSSRASARAQDSAAAPPLASFALPTAEPDSHAEVRAGARTSSSTRDAAGSRAILARFVSRGSQRSCAAAAPDPAGSTAITESQLSPTPEACPAPQLHSRHKPAARQPPSIAVDVEPEPGGPSDALPVVLSPSSRQLEAQLASLPATQTQHPSMQMSPDQHDDLSTAQEQQQLQPPDLLPPPPQHNALPTPHTQRQPHNDGAASGEASAGFAAPEPDETADGMHIMDWCQAPVVPSSTHTAHDSLPSLPGRMDRTTPAAVQPGHQLESSTQRGSAVAESCPVDSMSGGGPAAEPSAANGQRVQGDGDGCTTNEAGTAGVRRIGDGTGASQGGMAVHPVPLGQVVDLVTNEWQEPAVYAQQQPAPSPSAPDTTDTAPVIDLAMDDVDAQVELPQLPVELEAAVDACAAPPGAGMTVSSEGVASIGFDMDAVLRATRRRAELRRTQRTEPAPLSRRTSGMLTRFAAASLQAAGASGSRSESEVAAEEELDRVFDKSQFRAMEVVGQFNLGFIIARLGRDLFIVDQHASDEKHNFERLQASVVLNRQPLLQPCPLHLDAGDALLLQDALPAFRRSGFDFVESPSTGEWLLSAVPFSRNTVFGPDDVVEMVGMLRAGLRPEEARPSRVRSMLAMRACRSSIMIGTALSSGQMQRVLAHLSALQQPWNCPHGRPTMRHLCVLPLKSEDV